MFEILEYLMIGRNKKKVSEGHLLKTEMKFELMLRTGRNEKK